MDDEHSWFCRRAGCDAGTRSYVASEAAADAAAQAHTDSSAHITVVEHWYDSGTIDLGDGNGPVPHRHVDEHILQATP